MKIIFHTSAKGVESANCLLRIAAELLNANPELRGREGINKIDIKHAITFQKKLLDAFLKTGKSKI